jgi:acetate---CoA ligase (ADP-forming)
LDAACAAIAALAGAAASLAAQVQELEINPLLVRAQGGGAVALDALVLVRPAP